MITTLTELLETAAGNLSKKFACNAKVEDSKHFGDRMFERFEKNEFEQLERAVEYAFKMLQPGNKASRIKHPAYKITVVAQKWGLNGLKLVTCYKEGDE